MDEKNKSVALVWDNEIPFTEDLVKNERREDLFENNETVY